MFVTKLEVVNACLATLGESPLNTLEDDHSFKAAALQKLDEANKALQKRGWWFNSEYIELVPDALSKYINIPLDAIAVKPIPHFGPVFAPRGKRLYDPVRNTYEWNFNVGVDCVRLMSFEDLPFHAADAVSSRAIVRFQNRFDGDTVRYQELLLEARIAQTELVSENVRNVRPNLLATQSNLHKMGTIGGFGRVGNRIPWTPGWPR